MGGVVRDLFDRRLNDTQPQIDLDRETDPQRGRFLFLI
jgi:hypothetical protein